MIHSTHCPVIHAGLSIFLSQTQTTINHCCVREGSISIKNQDPIWNNKKLIPLRQINDQGVWDKSCWACQQAELGGLESYRTGMIEKFGFCRTGSGPVRLDLMFDNSCNLACRTCRPESSTFWQKHLKDNNLKVEASADSKADEMMSILKNIDLSNLEMVVIAGGESLMGKKYWQMAELIADLAPQAKEKITFSFQTNGTQPIDEKYFPIIDRFKLVKLNISIDAIGDKFHYLRWPADWQQVTTNMFALRNTLPVNVMFAVEETLSIFNLYYKSELEEWLKENFSRSRLVPSAKRPDGDPILHQQHLAFGIFGLDNITQKYKDSLPKNVQGLISPNWKENPIQIKRMIDEIQKFDRIRNQDWTKTFPDVAEFYSDYLR